MIHLNLLVETKNTDADVLGGDQLAVVEKGKLNGTAADIQDGRAGLDHLFKGAGPESDGLIVQETLLGVSQDIHVDPCLVLDLVQDDGSTGQFPDGAGEGWLGNVQHLRSLVQGAKLGDGDGVAQLLT